MDPKEVRRRIGYFRNKANLSQKALSFAIDKNEAYINKMENGEYFPSLKVLLKIIEVCGITTEEFFYEDLNSYKIDKEILMLLKNADENKKLAIKQLLK